jgi:hypothetical protein
VPWITNCTRCGETFEAGGEGHAKATGRICGDCADDLRDEADARESAAEHDATGPHEATTDEF